MKKKTILSLGLSVIMLGGTTACSTQATSQAQAQSERKTSIAKISNAKTNENVRPSNHRSVKKTILATGMALSVLGATTACGNANAAVKPAQHKAPVTAQVQKAKAVAKSTAKSKKSAKTATKQVANATARAKAAPESAVKRQSTTSAPVKKATASTVHHQSASSKPEAAIKTTTSTATKKYTSASRPAAHDSSSTPKKTISHSSGSATKHSSSSVAGPNMSSSDMANLQNTINNINSGNVKFAGSSQTNAGTTENTYIVGK